MLMIATLSDRHSLGSWFQPPADGPSLWPSGNAVESRDSSTFA
jgi:hypothetical protein